MVKFHKREGIHNIYNQNFQHRLAKINLRTKAMFNILNPKLKNTVLLPKLKHHTSYRTSWLYGLRFVFRGYQCDVCLRYKEDVITKYGHTFCNYGCEAIYISRVGFDATTLFDIAFNYDFSQRDFNCK